MNYISGVRFLHKELGLTLPTIDSFLVTSLLQVADITMRTLPLRCLPIFPHLRHQLCLLTTSLRPLGPSMQVCFTNGPFAMLRQSNRALSSSSHFNPSWLTCRGDIITVPLGLLILVRWSKMHQQDSGLADH